MGEASNEIWAGLHLQRKLSNVKHLKYGIRQLSVIYRRGRRSCSKSFRLDKQEASTGLFEELRTSRNHAKDETQELVI